VTMVAKVATAQRMGFIVRADHQNLRDPPVSAVSR
jgi:hypothetical protein